MLIGEWQAKLIKDPPGIRGALLYLWRDSGDGGTDFLLKNGEVKVMPRDRMFPVNEDYSFAFFDPEQLEAIAEAFSRSGIKTLNEHRAEGLLEAKEAHLQDMRALVFKEKRRA